MKEVILGINTIGEKMEVCLIEGQKIINFLDWDKNNNESEKVLRNVSNLIDCTNLKLNDIGYIAITVGPGSYTGTRIGVSIANALAYSLEAKIIEINAHDLENIDLKNLLTSLEISDVTTLKVAIPVYAKQPTITLKKF